VEHSGSGWQRRSTSLCLILVITVGLVISYCAVAAAVRRLTNLLFQLLHRFRKVGTGAEPAEATTAALCCCIVVAFLCHREDGLERQR